jgi:exodeoxyribonuclease X
MEDVLREASFDPADALLSGEPIGILAAHNAAFEQKFMGETEQPWICTYKCALRVWPDVPGHSNQVLRYWLEDQGLLSLDADKAMPPHRAGPDAYVTAHILLALLKVATVEQMIEWTKEPRLLPRCTIGKFRGKPWAEVEWGFLNWMLQQATMEEDLKWNARRELDRRTKTISA